MWPILAYRARRESSTPVLVDANALTSLLMPYPSEEMEAYEVSTVVNSPRNDTPDCIAPPVVTKILFG